LARAWASSAARPVHFGREGVNRLTHAVESGKLECVNSINCRVDIVECRLQFFNADRSIGGLVGDFQGLLAQHLRGRLDDVAGGRVQRCDLIEDQLLIAERQRRDDGGAQRRDRGRGRPFDALDQFEVVLADQVERQVPLHDDSQLGKQVLALLTNVEERVFLERQRLLRFG
jgi:hypothetical protein